MDTSEAHAERAVLREQLDRAYDVLQLKRTEERNMVQDVAQVCQHTAPIMSHMSWSPLATLQLCQVAHDSRHLQACSCATLLMIGIACKVVAVRL